MKRRMIHIIVLGLVVGVTSFIFFLCLKEKFDISGEQRFKTLSIHVPSDSMLDSISIDSFGHVLPGSLNFEDLIFVNPVGVEQHLAKFEKKVVDSRTYQKNLAFVLTDSVASAFSELNNFDSTRALINWAISYSNHSTYSDYPVFFDVVADYWFLFSIDSVLTPKVSLDEELKYDFRVRCLQELLLDYSYNLSIRESQFEKLVKYIHQGKWKYIFIARFWKTTSLAFKLVVGLILIMLIFGLYKYVTHE